jgi:hypothetical protein
MYAKTIKPIMSSKFNTVNWYGRSEAITWSIVFALIYARESVANEPMV